MTMLGRPKRGEQRYQVYCFLPRVMVGVSETVLCSMGYEATILSDNISEVVRVDLVSGPCAVLG